MQTVSFISRATPLFPSWSAWSQASKLCEDGDTNWRGESNRMAGIHPGPALVTLEQPSEQLLCRVTCLGSLFSPQPFQYRNALRQMNTCCVPVREPDSSGLSPHSIWKVEGPTLSVLKFYNACCSFNIKCSPKGSGAKGLVAGCWRQSLCYSDFLSGLLTS